MLLANPSFIDEVIVPTIKSYSTNQYENLFFQSDLRNISTFLSRFNPRDGIFEWVPPEGISFQKIDFLYKIENRTLDEIAHFLFNFYFIGRCDCCNYFAKLLESHQTQLLSKIESANLRDIDFFLWNLWMALPGNETPSLIQDRTFTNRIIEKATEAKDEQGNILGIVGTLELSRYEVPKKLFGLIKPETAKNLCLNAVESCSIKSIRLFGGLSSVLPDIPSVEKKSYLNHLEKLTFDIEVPNQCCALNRLRLWLER